MYGNGSSNYDKGSGFMVTVPLTVIKVPECMVTVPTTVVGVPLGIMGKE